jgi:hypothetical protein
VLSVTSLVMTLAQDNLNAFSICYQKAVDRLSKVCIFHLGFGGVTIPCPLRYSVHRSSCSKTLLSTICTTRCRSLGFKSNCSVCYNITLLLASLEDARFERPIADSLLQTIPRSNSCFTTYCKPF